MNRTVIRTMTRASTHALCSGVALLLLAEAARAQFYAMTDLGTLGGDNAIAYCINNHEQIVGVAQTGMSNYHAFMFEGGRMMDLGTMGGSNSWAFGINDNGWMVGMAGLPGTDMHAFLMTNATFTMQGRSMADAGQYSVAMRNGVGTVAMASTTVSMFAMRRTDGTLHLMVAAPIGSHFRIDYSDMVGSSANWQAMTNLTVMGSMSQITDAPPPGSHARFYRAVMMP
jgi:probable HAF family extracellular repeat protein